MKVVLDAAGLPHAAVRRDHRPCVAHRSRRAAARRWTRSATRCSSSPAGAGRASGSARCGDRDGLDEAVEEARRWDPKVIVEASAGVGAREIECGVLEGLDDAPAEASVVAEITVEGDHDFYDFAAKYLPEEQHPARRPRRAAAARWRRRCAGSRSRPSRRCPARGWRAWTSSCWPTAGSCSTRSTRCPGFTPTSMFPRMWAATGLDYPALVDRLAPARAAAGVPVFAERLSVQRPVAGMSSSIAVGEVGQRGRRRPVLAGQLAARRSPRGSSVVIVTVPCSSPGGATSSSGRYQSTPLTVRQAGGRVEALGRPRPPQVEHDRRVAPGRAERVGRGRPRAASWSGDGRRERRRGSRRQACSVDAGPAFGGSTLDGAGGAARRRRRQATSDRAAR